MQKFLISLSCLFLFNGLCFANEINRIHINNSYNIFSDPEFMPTEKIIKKQIITTYAQDNDGPLKTTYHANEKGFFEKAITSDAQYNIDVDYSVHSIKYLNKKLWFRLNEQQNITSIVDDKQQNVSSLIYNQSGQLIEKNTDDEVWQQPLKRLYEYANNKVVRYTECWEDGCSLGEYSYNPAGWLIKVKSKSIDDNANNGQSKNNKTNNSNSYNIKCTFAKHNQYGDWTYGYCITPDGVTNTTFYRKLEYW